MDAPDTEDGVAGVRQDAVPPGGEHVYRFAVEDAGTPGRRDVLLPGPVAHVAYAGVTAS